MLGSALNIRSILCSFLQSRCWPVQFACTYWIVTACTKTSYYQENRFHRLPRLSLVQSCFLFPFLGVGDCQKLLSIYLYDTCIYLLSQIYFGYFLTLNVINKNGNSGYNSYKNILRSTIKNQSFCLELKVKKCIKKFDSSRSPKIPDSLTC